MSDVLKYQATWIAGVTLKDLRKGKRYVWHEGGSRSGKTVNVAVANILYAAETGHLVSVVRQSLPVIRKTVLRDYIEVANALGLYSEANHNKTEQIVKVGRGAVEFFAVDDEQKVRGAKRHVLHMNEANEIGDDKRRQLWMRTTGSIVIDHNPFPDDDHWIVSKLEPRILTGEAVRYHSTYKDNPFLEQATVREIESMQYDDPYGWRLYGLGERGTNPAAVFEDISLGAFDPQGDTVYGVDFGYKDPFVVCEWGWRDSNPPSVPKATLYCRPIVYGSHLTTPEAISILEERGAVRRKPMFCDAAEPDRIQELKKAGFDARPAKKTTGARDAGYAWLRRHRIVVDHTVEESGAVRSELKKTRHKQKPGSDKFLDEIVDADDHVADSARYGAFSTWGQSQIRTGVIGTIKMSVR